MKVVLDYCKLMRENADMGIFTDERPLLTSALWCCCDVSV